MSEVSSQALVKRCVEVPWGPISVLSNREAS
jgi:hypothetical protein